MKIIKKLMQIALAVFFFGLLATSAVLADDADSEGWQFVQEMVEPTTRRVRSKKRPGELLMARPIILIMYQEKWLSAGNISRFHLKVVQLVLTQMV